MRRLALTKYMSEKLSIDAKVTPVHVADGAVGVIKLMAKISKKYYGVWGDDGMTDEELVKELKSLRSFNHDIIEL